MLLVTGASGGLGGLVLARVPEDSIAGTTTPGRVSRTGPVRHVDFDDPMSLKTAFTDVDTMLLISAGYGEDDVVIARHGAAIDAAEHAGVRHIVYTSVAGCGDHLAFALPHRWTERRLIASSADWTILRNGIYAEMSVPGALDAARTGALTGPLGTGKLAAVAREDLADVTAAVLADPASHARKVYELVGDTAIGGTGIAAAVAEATGKDISYEPSTLAELRTALDTQGVPGWQVPIVTSLYSAVAAGFMAETDSGDLRALLGRAPRSALDVITTAVRSADD